MSHESIQFNNGIQQPKSVSQQLTHDEVHVQPNTSGQAEQPREESNQAYGTGDSCNKVNLVKAESSYRCCKCFGFHWATLAVVRKCPEPIHLHTSTTPRCLVCAHGLRWIVLTVTYDSSDWAKRKMRYRGIGRRCNWPLRGQLELELCYCKIYGVHNKHSGLELARWFRHYSLEIHEQEPLTHCGSQTKAEYLQIRLLLIQLVLTVNRWVWIKPNSSY